jgi:hypothetical protein
MGKPHFWKQSEPPSHLQIHQAQGNDMSSCQLHHPKGRRTFSETLIFFILGTFAVLFVAVVLLSAVLSAPTATSGAGAGAGASASGQI